MVDSVFPASTPFQLAANTPLRVIEQSDVEFQFLSGAVNVTRSLDGVNYVPWPVMDGNGAIYSSASAPGIWTTDGNAYLKFSADVVVRVGE